METPVSNSSGIDVASDAIEPSAPSNEFSVHLANFDGPFDLLLQLISRHKLDITEISLSLVTDEFIAFIRALELSGEGWRLDQATEFLVVAATLLDLKAARLRQPICAQTLLVEQLRQHSRIGNIALLRPDSAEHGSAQAHRRFSTVLLVYRDDEARGIVARHRKKSRLEVQRQLQLYLRARRISNPLLPW